MPEPVLRPAKPDRGDTERQRVKQTAPDGTTHYINDTAAGLKTEKFIGASSTRWNNYVYAAGGIVAVVYVDSTAGSSTRYFHKDHLGSTAVITNESGAVVETLAYDSWGKRRHPNGNDDPTNSITSLTDRGFTGHEHLQEVALVHMNGRVYDPLLGRFLSADPIIQDPLNTQSLNRYSYVLNNPLAYTDPNGFFFKSLFKAIGNLFSGIVSAVRSVLSNPIVQSVLQIVAAVVCSPGGPVASAGCAAGVAAISAGINGGSVGDMIKAGAITFATAMAFQAVGDVTGAHLMQDVNGNWVYGGEGFENLTPEQFFGSPRHFANIAGHAAVGCASAAAAGGKCASGALSAAPGALAGPKLTNLGFEAKLVAKAVIGGTGSVLGGGKFENGAVTGAFGYLFNEFGTELTRGYAATSESGAGSFIRGIPIIGKFFEGFSAGPVLGGRGMFGIAGGEVEVGVQIDTVGRQCIVTNACLLLGLGMGVQGSVGAQVSTGTLREGSTPNIGVTGGFSAGSVGAHLSPFSIGLDGSISATGAPIAPGVFLGGAVKMCGQEVSGCK